MPRSNYDISKNDRNREQTEHAQVTASDVPGSGGARRAAEAVEKRKDRNKDALEAARRALRGK